MADPTNVRPFGFWTATALIVGGMIGSGIFLMPSVLAPYGWTSVAAWGVSIGGAMAVAYTLARLARSLPAAPGAVAAIGEVLGPLPGVMIGWSYWVATWASVAAIAIAATSYLAVFLPGLNANPLIGALVSVGLIWALTLLNLSGAKRAGEFQVVTTVLKLAPLLVVAVIGVWLDATGKAAPLPVPAPRTLLAGLSAAVALTLFPLLGFEAAGIAAARVRNPARNVMRATIVGTLVTGLLYVVVCSAIILLLPPRAVAASPAPFQLFVETFWGRGPAVSVALFAAIAAIGALNGWTLIEGEVPLSMARAGLLPRWFGRVSRRDVPVRVMVLSSLLASALVLSNASATLGGVFTFAALLSTCASLWLYTAICVAALLRRVAVVTASVGLPFALFAFWGAGYEASGLSLLLMLTAVPVYLLRSRRALAKQPA